MGNHVKGGCNDRLISGAYVRIVCRMPCASTDARVKRAIYNELKGTELACPVKDMYISRPLGTDPVEMFDKPTGSCNFGWGCRRTTPQAKRKNARTEQNVGPWLEIAQFFLLPIKSALQFLAILAN